MQQWEYLHVRGKVGISDLNPYSMGYERKTYAVFHVNGQEFNLAVDESKADIQNSVIELLDTLGRDGWELVSHTDRVIDMGMLPGPTEYTFFLKRPLASA